MPVCTSNNAKHRIGDGSPRTFRLWGNNTAQQHCLEGKPMPADMSKQRTAWRQRMFAQAQIDSTGWLPRAVDYLNVIELIAQLPMLVAS